MSKISLKLWPTVALGTWTLALVILMPVLFTIGMSFTDTLYDDVPAGGTILKDILARPALSLTMLAGMAAGTVAFITGLLAIFKQRERSILVFIATLIAGLMVFFWVAHLFPE